MLEKINTAKIVTTTVYYKPKVLKTLTKKRNFSHTLAFNHNFDGISARPLDMMLMSAQFALISSIPL